MRDSATAIDALTDRKELSAEVDRGGIRQREECKRVRINFDKPGKGSWDTKASKTKLDNASVKGAKEKNGTGNVGGSPDEIQERRSELIRNPAAWTEKENVKGGKENVAEVDMERGEG